MSYDTLRRQFLSYKAHHRQVTLKCVQQLKLHICTDIPNKRLIRKHTMIHSVQILKNLVPTTTTYSVTVFLLLLLLFLKLYSKTEVIICQSNLKKEKEKKPFIKTPGRGISAFHNLYFSFLPQHLCTIIALNRQIFISQNREFWQCIARHKENCGLDQFITPCLCPPPPPQLYLGMEGHVNSNTDKPQNMHLSMAGITQKVKVGTG